MPTVTCTRCGGRFQVARRRAGKKLRCLYCQRIFVVADGDEDEWVPRRSEGPDRARRRRDRSRRGRRREEKEPGGIEDLPWLLIIPVLVLLVGGAAGAGYLLARSRAADEVAAAEAPDDSSPATGRDEKRPPADAGAAPDGPPAGETPSEEVRQAQEMLLGKWVGDEGLTKGLTFEFFEDGTYSVAGRGPAQKGLKYKLVDANTLWMQGSKGSVDATMPMKLTPEELELTSKPVSTNPKDREEDNPLSRLEFVMHFRRPNADDPAPGTTGAAESPPSTRKGPAGRPGTRPAGRPSRRP